MSSGVLVVAAGRSSSAQPRSARTTAPAALVTSLPAPRLGRREYLTEGHGGAVPGRRAPPHDPSKPPGRGQQAPLTPEYQAIFEANLRDQAIGGQGNDVTRICLPNGMPRAMSAYEPLELIVTPDLTYILIDHIEHTRRIYTDGRAWPATVEPTFVGYSIGQWIDADGDGHAVLEVETRGFRARASKTPAAFRCTRTARPSSKSGFISTGPIRARCGTITTFDNALTRP
jgi:hypothetical protein